MDEATRHQVELTLERSRRWRRQFVAQHGPDYEDDETFRLVRDLDQLLRAATRQPDTQSRDDEVGD